MAEFWCVQQQPYRESLCNSGNSENVPADQLFRKLSPFADGSRLRSHARLQLVRATAQLRQQHGLK
ncbi:hypothetical protein, partial [Agrobacterium sp.]|uniref:hypothetical protein n=1 Tax=Agrobacterium sp. TaxID=361 RepID=UPI0025BA2790